MEQDNSQTLRSRGVKSNEAIVKSLLSKMRRQNPNKRLSFEEYNAFRRQFELPDATEEEYKKTVLAESESSKTAAPVQISQSNIDASILSRYYLFLLFSLAVTFCIGLFIYAFKNSENLTLESCMSDTEACWKTITENLFENKQVPLEDL